MSIRLIASFALLASIHNVHAESFINYQNHDTVVASSECDAIGERSAHSGEISHVNAISLAKAQPVALYGMPLSNKKAILVNTGKRDHFSQHPDLPVCHWTELVLKQHTRFKLGRAVLKYMPSNRNHSMERFYQRKRTAIVI